MVDFKKTLINKIEKYKLKIDVLQDLLADLPEEEPKNDEDNY